MINYVDKMADALVDVLKYSNQDVEWVEPDDMKPNDGVQPEWFYPAIVFITIEQPKLIRNIRV